MSTEPNQTTSSKPGPIVVWTTNLELGTLSALLGIFLRHGRFRLRYTATSKSGKMLARLFKGTRILSSVEPAEFSLHGLRVDDADSPRLLVQGWLPNKFAELFMHSIESVLDKFDYPNKSVRRDRVLINLRKAAAQTTVDVLAFLELARYHHQVNKEVNCRLVVITPHATLAHLIPEAWVGGNVKFIAPWNRQYSLVLRLGRSLVRFLGDALRQGREKADRPPTIAAAAAWGINPSDRLNDLFWWWESNIPAERTILFFDRSDSPASRDTMTKARKVGIECVVLGKDAVGDSPHLLWHACPGFKTAAVRLWRSFRMFCWGASRGRSRRWIARQAMDMMHNADRMEDFLSDFNVKGLFHHQDGGLDYQSLACDSTGAARIGHHWSYFPWPETAVSRLHQVYFVWGPYQAEMLEATGSQIDHVLWSGCTVQGAYPGSKFEGASNPDRSAVESNGAENVIALFDTSLPCQGFYKYFLEKIIRTPHLGLLIKPKNSQLPWLRYNLTELGSLYEKAVATGRVRLLNHTMSPTEAAAAADISVAVDINSAAVCAALGGHRAVHIDYLRVHSSPLKEWATLHRSGPDQVVFDNPDKLWEALDRFFENPESEASLGVVKDTVLKHIDPFRDGRAGERIGEYLSWYLEALDSNLEREPALELAGSKYAYKWGSQTISTGLTDSLGLDNQMDKPTKTEHSNLTPPNVINFQPPSINHSDNGEQTQ